MPCERKTFRFPRSRNENQRCFRRRLAERFGDKHVVDGAIVYSLSAQRLASAAPAEIRALQFTNRKAEYIVAVAQAVASGQVNVERLATLSDAAVIEELVALRGIGVWTAEWILARTLGRPRVVAGENVSRRTFVLRLFNRPLGFQIKVFQEELAFVIEIIERDQQRCLFIVIVVALRPLCARQRRVLAVPRARGLVRPGTP